MLLKKEQSVSCIESTDVKSPLCEVDSEKKRQRFSSWFVAFRLFSFRQALRHCFGRYTKDSSTRIKYEHSLDCRLDDLQEIVNHRENTVCIRLRNSTDQTDHTVCVHSNLSIKP